MLKLMLGTLALSTFLTSCGSKDTVRSDDVNENKIYGKYSVRFDYQRSTVEYFTQFRLGGSTGTTINLKEPSKITVSSRGLQLQDGTTNPINLNGTFYSLTEATTLPSENYTFAWTRSDGVIYENVVTMPRPSKVLSPIENSIYSKSSGDLTIVFDGEDLRADEKTSCVVFSAQVTTSQYVSTGKQCIILKNEMQRFTNGAASVYLIRHRSQPATKGHDVAGGSLVSDYLSKYVNISVAD